MTDSPGRTDPDQSASSADTGTSPWASPATRTELPRPAESGARRAEPRRGPSRWLVAVIATVVVLGAIGTALAVQASGKLRTLPTPTPAGESLTPEPVQTGYLAPGDLCEQADYTRMRPTFTTFGDLYRRRSATAGLVVVACEGSTGNETVDGRFAFEVQVSTHPDALGALFDEQQASVAARVPVTAIDGLGSRAYRYVAVSQTGLTVEVYDDNLIMRLEWSAEAGGRAPDGLDRALVETCRENLRLFRSN